MIAPGIPSTAPSLSVKGAADRLGVCAKTVYRLIWCRRLGHIRFGRSIRVTEKHLENYRKAYEVDAVHELN
jgi:excisionase family DNA binding protein